MPVGDYLPKEDAQLRSWLENFYTQCEKYETELNLNTTILTNLASQTQGFTTNLSGVTTAKADLKSIVSEKNTSKATIVANVRGLVKDFKADPSIPASILNALEVIAQPDSGPVVSVNDVTVLGCDDGVNKLKWNRNGNTGSTLFLIESKLPSQSAWILVGAVTKTSFNHENQVPGQTRLYRIISSRAGITSAPTAPVIVYGEMGDTTLSIAA